VYLVVVITVNSAESVADVGAAEEALVFSPRRSAWNVETHADHLLLFSRTGPNPSKKDGTA
jgi:hypothetical protein